MKTYIVAKSSIDWILIEKELWEKGRDDFCTVVKEFEAATWQDAEKVFDNVSKIYLT